MSSKKKYPAQISFQLRSDTYDVIAEEAQQRGGPKADVAREYLEHGRVLVEALASVPGLAERVEALRSEAGVSRADAIARMLDFAARQATRRQGIFETVATGLAGSMAASGIPFDGVEVGTTSITIESSGD